MTLRQYLAACAIAMALGGSLAAFLPERPKAAPAAILPLGAFGIALVSP